MIFPAPSKLSRRAFSRLSRIFPWVFITFNVNVHYVANVDGRAGARRPSSQRHTAFGLHADVDESHIAIYGQHGSFNNTTFEAVAADALLQSSAKFL